MKVVVVGTGFGSYVMAPAWSNAGCEVEVVSPRDADAFRRALDGGADVASIHSPPFLHAEHVLQALERRVPVLCDKPFGRDAGDARLLLDRAREAGVPAFVNFELRCQPARKQAKELVEAGAIGALRHVTLTMFGSGLRDHAYGWLSDTALGGGWMGAYGAHGIDMLLWIAGSEVARCGGLARIEVAQRRDRDGVAHDCSAEDAFSAWFELANGVTASFDTGFSGATNLPERIVLHGSEGALELVDDALLIRHGPRGAAEQWEYPDVAKDRYGLALANWLPAILEAIREGRAMAPGFADGVAVTDVLDRLKASVAHASAQPGAARPG